MFEIVIGVLIGVIGNFIYDLLKQYLKKKRKV